MIDSFNSVLTERLKRAFWLASISFIPGTFIGFFVVLITGGMGCCAGNHSPFKALAPLAWVFLLPLNYLQSFQFMNMPITTPHVLLITCVSQFTYYFVVFSFILCGKSLFLSELPAIGRSDDIVYCPQCGAQLEPPRAGYCRKCGTLRSKE
ncbi:MAG: zinc-ribbon domain-containing protein [Planctomycetes bacterium]|nr:zinc-ribbon domain-containing protein [Planctomycetota bacterium]